MAPIIELSNLSSNWKKLQQTLQPSKPSTSAPKPVKSDEKEQQNSLKRKRSRAPNGTRAQESSATLAKTDHRIVKKPLARKRQKMDEPPSIGASAKQHGTKTLSKSISMPTLKQTSLLSDPKATSQSISVLAASPDHPDIENEGMSSTALYGKYISVDCEMVGTGPMPDRDSALARVSVVNFHGHQVYDSYVQVEVPVTDYRTAVSGIEPRHLRKDVARPFKEVHKDLKVLLEGRILVGHGLKNDLDCLLLKHDKRYVRDTSKFSEFRKLAYIPGRTPRLKDLVEKLLGVEIQTGAHSSVEDARATMALFRLRKPAFEDEIVKLYGHVRMQNAGMDVDIGTQEATSKNRTQKKKKKKRKA